MAAVHWKLATLTALERLAGLARRLRLGFIIDRVAPLVGRPFERFVIDVDGVLLGGATLAQLHYVRELLEQGRERTFVRLLAEAVPPGGTVLEGGAHLGFVTVHAARAAGPTGRVVVFEPNRSIHESLLTNLANNDVADRVELVPKALGEAAARVRFFVSDDTSSLFRPAAGAVVEEVDVVRADEAITGRVDVVKLDIEGGESAALRGMEGLFTATEPPVSVFVECFPELLEQAGSSRDELIGLLGAYGYRVEWIDEVTGRTAALSEPWPGDYVNLLCTRSR
jgi:FkbM family methyltransferase